MGCGPSQKCSGCPELTKMKTLDGKDAIYSYGCRLGLRPKNCTRR